MKRWWIDEPLILGVSNPSENDLRDLYQEGFRIIISLLDDTRQSHNYNISQAKGLGYKWHNFPITDFHAPTLGQLFDFVDSLKAISDKFKVLIHCEGGSGRTGTMGAAYWIAKGLSANDAIRKVREANPDAVETDEQELMLSNFESDYKVHEEALLAFRKVVALLYREIGMLKSRNHPELAAKRKKESGFFSTPERKIMALKISLKNKEQSDPQSILPPFEECTGLSLSDIERAFREGNWKNSLGGYSYGGPKWALIAQTTISLKDAISKHDITKVKRLLKDISGLEHNNGRIIDKFRELD